MDRAVPQGDGGPGSGVADLFVEKLRAIAAARGKPARAAAIDDLARAVHETDSTLPFFTRLLETDRHGQRLVLELATRIPLPLSEPACRLIVPVLSNTRFPASLRLSAAVRVLQSVADGWPLIPVLLDSLLFSLSHDRARERLGFLLTRCPEHPVLVTRLEALRHSAELPCPRCGVRLARPELIVHLWEVHRLLIDGTRAREPWKVIEDWVRDYARTGRQEVLDRACELGQQLDPDGGLTRVHRLLLAAGLTDDEARDNLTAQVGGERSTLCPHCYASVATAHEPLPTPYDLSAGRIFDRDFQVEVSDEYLLTNLYIANERDVLHNGPEPGHGLTSRGQTVLFLGPLTLMALALAIALPVDLVVPLTPVSLLLFVALLVYVRIRRRGPPTPDAARRAVDHAWQRLAPRLHDPEFSNRDADFAARLAMTSIGVGSPELRNQVLRKLVSSTVRRVRDGFLDARSLAALRCLEFDDAIRTGEDPLPNLAQEIAAALIGDLPFVFAELLIEGTAVAGWDAGQRARLRALVCTAAFDGDLGPAELGEIGRLSKSLEPLFGTEIRAFLHRLHWVWANRGDPPWKRLGSASTVFDLARHSSLGIRHFEQHPDLLLFQPTSMGGAEGEHAAPILICESGIAYRTILIRNASAVLALLDAGPPFGLVVAGQTLSFQEDPTRLVQRLQGWLNFLFGRLLPGAEPNDRFDSETLLPIFDQKAVRCTECGNEFVAVGGGIGVPMPLEAGV